MGLFDEQVSRKPNNYPWTQNIIDALWHSHWTPNEFNFRADNGQFRTELTPKEQQVVIRTATLIGQIEIAVKRFWGDIGKVFKHPSINDMGFVMANNEVIHNIAYEKLLDVLGLQSAFDEALKEPVVAGRVEYLRKYLGKVYDDDRKQFVYALILFTIFIEGTSLFGPFYTILHFKRFRNVLPDMAQQVQYTRIEEQLHTKAGVLLINTLRQEYPELFDADLYERVREEVANAVLYEGRVVDWMLDGYEGRNLSPAILKAYLKDRLNKIMVEAGFPPLDQSKDERDLLPRTIWMEEEMKGDNLTDFFAQRPVEYSKKHRTYNEEDLF